MSLNPVQLCLHLNHSSAPTPVLYIKLQVSYAIYISILYINTIILIPVTLHTVSHTCWSHKKLSLTKKLGCRNTIKCTSHKRNSIQQQTSQYVLHTHFYTKKFKFSWKLLCVWVMGLLCFEGTTTLHNIRNYLANNVSKYPLITESSTPPLWEPQI
jgi:hypothetical protein